MKTVPATLTMALDVCKCQTWCDSGAQHRILTGHHKFCPDSPDELKCALALIKDLAYAMEEWAADEDGIHEKAWKPYCHAKALEGVFLNPEREEQ